MRPTALARLVALALLCAALALPLCVGARADSPSLTAAPARRMVYLTFDDGPTEKTPALLEALRQADVQATFFLIGASVEQYPENARAIRDAGHALGCHSYHHARKHLTDETRFFFEMRRFNRAIRDAFGRPIHIRLFRFPYGSGWTSQAMQRMVVEAGYLWIDWNALNGDADVSISRDADRMMAEALTTSGEQDEIVLLMHDGKDRTIQMLPALIQHYRDAGYGFDVLTPQFDHLIPHVHMGLPSGEMQ